MICMKSMLFFFFVTVVTHPSPYLFRRERRASIPSQFLLLRIRGIYSFCVLIGQNQGHLFLLRSYWSESGLQCITLVAS
uniref:Uncharacterized protein n=1 Tax=Anguilla anguilla TaxID=7936 RepID=A0A0E9WVB1_ANGAN